MLPVVGVALAELAAIPLLAVGTHALLRGKWQWVPADAGVLTWTAGALLACLFFVARAGWGAASDIVYEALVAVYLAGIYLAVRATASATTLEAFPKLFRAAALTAAVIALAAWALALVGIWTPLVFRLPHYLYIGSLPQAQGFLPSKNMLASLLGVALILEPHRPALLLAALVASFSRSGLAFAAGFLIARVADGQRRRALCVALSGVLILAYVGGSHLGLVWSEEERRGLMLHVAGRPVVCFGSKGGAPCAYWTVYYATKAASLEAIARTWPWGLGPGKQDQFEEQLKSEGGYPAEMPAYRPHSSYTGVPAEYGAAGLIGFVVFAGSVVLTMRRVLRGTGGDPQFGARAAGALAMIAIEAVTTDVMHFRHLFWLVAVVGAHAAVGRRSESLVSSPNA